MTGAPEAQPSSTARVISDALAGLGPGPLDEAQVERHLRPLFSRVLGAGRRIYLANHSLGRPLDRLHDDVKEALDLWTERLGDAWTGWLAEIADYRGRFARLLNAADAQCVIPKTSAGQGLRAILNSSEQGSARTRVLTTRGEFDSIDTVLRQYATRGRISISWLEPDAEGLFDPRRLRAALAQGIDLVVVSQVMFASGQVVAQLPELVREAHASGARVMLDVYHALGVFPVDVTALDVDYAIGGSYKYLRGGPGACFLYIHPRHLDGSLSTLDVGWFAKKTRYVYDASDDPGLASGGDAFLESTPPVLPFYQSRAGQLFTLGIGAERLRAYSLERQQILVDALAGRDVRAVGARVDRGAFVVVRRPDAPAVAAALSDAGIAADARGDYLRLCPDVLSTRDELEAAAATMGRVLASR